MQIPLYVRPFVDGHLPSRIGNICVEAQSFSQLGPRTNHSTPIARRTYYPCADSKVHFPIPRVDRVAVIDTSTMGFPGPSESLTCASFSGRTQIFSLLAPRPPAFEQTLFPGQVYPNQCGPLDLPNITAFTLGERFVQLREARFAIISLYSRLREELPRWLVEELDDPRLTWYEERNSKRSTSIGGISFGVSTQYTTHSSWSLKPPIFEVPPMHIIDFGRMPLVTRLITSP